MFLSVVAAERGTVAMVVDFLDSVSFVKFRGCVLNYMTIVRGNTVLVNFFFFLIGSLINHFL